MKTVKQYRHLLIAAGYGVFYLTCFHYLEQRVTRGYHLIHTPLDDMIPFCEFFVIPYLMWFGYIAWAIFYFGICNKNKKEYYQLIFNLGIGMTLFLVISYLYPNGQNLRPTEFPRSNVFTGLVQYVYGIDTPTNIFPSIHVYNSVAVATAVEKSEKFRKRPLIRKISTALAILIILSTMFLKQHSVSDVCCALVMNAGTYMLLYHQPGEHAARPIKGKKKEKVQIHI
ncbi:MAG: phosphatase PAP2 family protein [Lachnospiraceae bacterium]|nr:phosphatase PAP2 family protein [Lachnospiraceae bacterium]